MAVVKVNLAKVVFVRRIIQTLNNNIHVTARESSGNQSSKPTRPKSTNTLRKDLLIKTPIGKLEEIEGKHPYEEKEPLPAWKDGVNPSTGEIGGPKGPEPTRYGDWERKGRVTDF